MSVEALINCVGNPVKYKLFLSIEGYGQITTKELCELAQKIKDVIKPYYEFESAPGRQLRNIAVVYTPPAESK